MKWALEVVHTQIFENENSSKNSHNTMSNSTCNNCKRTSHPFLQESLSNNSLYLLSCTHIHSNDIYMRKFKHNDIVTNQNNVTYSLCQNCSNYLTLPTNYDAEENLWPTFFIRLLKNKNIQSKLSSRVWKVIRG